MIGRLRVAGIRIGMVLAMTATAVVGPGCNNGDFVPPPPPDQRVQTGGGSRGAAAGSSAAADPLGGGGTVGSIEMICARGVQDLDEEQNMKSAARSQAGFDHARLRILPDEDPAASRTAAAGAKSQAQLVREATARKPHALIVEAEDTGDAELARAVDEARAAKVPVVLLGRPIAGMKGTGPAPAILVRPHAFADSARQLVKLAMRNARNAKVNPEGGAILLIPTSGDSFVADRAAAVREALEEAKVSPVDEIPMPRNVDVGAQRLRKRLEADPKIAMVFAFDFTSITSSNTVASDIVEKRPFIQAGYTSDDNLPRMALAGEFAGIGEYVPIRLVKKAIDTAAALAQGREVTDPVEVPVAVKESPPAAGAPHLQAQQKKGRESKGG